MRRVFFTIVFLILFLGTSKACVILIYHKVGDNRTPSTNVSTQMFIKQMMYLKNHKYNVIPLKQLVNLLKVKKPLPKKCVVLTFDDGYKSVFYNAFPTIKKLNLPITVFLPTEAIEKHYPDYLTFQMIRTMIKYGVDFQSHSYSHPRFTSPPKGISGSQYINWIESNIQKSVVFFKKYLGYKPYAFAIPYGDYNMKVIKAAVMLGFQAILTQDATALDSHTPLWLLPRQPILGKHWSTMKHFQDVLNEGYVDLKRRVPSIGFCKKDQKIFGGVVENIKKYKKNSFRVYISEFGWLKAQVRGNFVYVTIKKSLTRTIERVGIMAVTKKGKVCKSLWMIEPVN